MRTSPLRLAAPILIGKTWLEQDHLIFNLPLRWYLSTALQAGQLPAWWSLVDLGAPFAANPNTGFFYPPAWLVALLPWDLAADLLQLLHLLWGGVGVVALATRLGAGRLGALFAGVVFVTSGSPGSLVVHGVTGYGLSWMPWTAVAAHHLASAEDARARLRAGLLLAVVGAGQILAGDPACVLTGGWLAFGVLLITARARTRALGGLAAAYLGAALLAACLLVPLAAAMGDSERAGGLAWEAASVWSLHPLRLVEAVWPGFLGPPRGGSSLAPVLAHAGGERHGPNWIATVTLGLPAISLAALALAGRPRPWRGYVLLMAALVLLALGAYTPFYGVFRRVFLPERMIRYPERHFLAIAVLVPALAGVGFSRLFAPERPRRAPRALAVAGTLLLLLSAFAWLLSASLGQALATAAMAPETIRAGVLTAAMGGAGTGATTLLLALAGSQAHRMAWLPALTLAAVTVMGMLNQGALLSKVDRQVVRRSSQTLAPAIAATRRAPLPERLRSSERSLFGSEEKDTAALLWSEHGRGNMAVLHGLAPYPGLSVMSPPAAGELWEARARGNERAILDLLGVRFFVGNAGRTPAPDFVLRTRNPVGLGLYENLRARPRAFATTNVKWWPRLPEGDGWKQVPDLDRDFIRLVATPPPAAAAHTARHFEPCALSSARPEHVALSCALPNAGYAVLLDAPARGWTATVDGRPAALLVADGLFRAVALPAGRHRVEFRYTMPGLRAGLTLTSVGLALLGLGLLWLRRGRQRRAEGPATPAPGPPHETAIAGQ